MSGGGPSAAAQARALVEAARSASLGTLDAQGAPFVSLVALVADARGRPLFLLSSLAEHTRNLRARPAASVLVAAPAPVPTLDRPRVTLSGQVAWLESAEADDARARFAAAVPESKVWLALPDFAPARLEVESVRYVGGFARAAVVPLEAYLA